MKALRKILHEAVLAADAERLNMLRHTLELSACARRLGFKPTCLDEYAIMLTHKVGTVPTDDLLRKGDECKAWVLANDAEIARRDAEDRGEEPL